MQSLNDYGTCLSLSYHDDRETSIIGMVVIHLCIYIDFPPILKMNYYYFTNFHVTAVGALN